MSGFTHDEDVDMSVEFLSSISVASWKLVASWSKVTKCAIVDPDDKKRALQRWGEGAPTFEEKRVIRAWIMYQATLKTQVPSYMAIDSALAKGNQVQYSETKATIPADNIEIPLSRVPLPTENLVKSKEGVVAPRVASDIVAASVGCMTRWTGQDVVPSIPIESLQKHEFVVAHPKGISDLASSIPPGPSSTGMKGRVWAYYLMYTLQRIPQVDYCRFVSRWARALFDLPPPSQGVVLKEKELRENFKMMRFKDQLYWTPTFGDMSLLTKMRAAFHAADYERVWAQVSTFSAVRQGDGSGISMLAQSGASWGLVSKTQAELEQVVSVALGALEELVILTGFNTMEYGRIAASVSRFSPSKKIKCKVEHYELKDPDTQCVSVPDNALWIIRGRTNYDTTAASSGKGVLKTFVESSIIEKVWKHVTQTCTQSNVVYLAAGIPPPPAEKSEATVNAFKAAAAWAGVFFWSIRPKLRRGVYLGEENGLGFEEDSPIAREVLYKAIVDGMNRALVSWIAPPINKNIRFSGLLTPAAVNKRIKVAWSCGEEDVEITYVQEEDDDEEKAEQADERPKVKEQGVAEKEKPAVERPIAPVTVIDMDEEAAEM